MIPFGTQKAPGPAVVLPYYGTAAVSFLILTVLLLLSAGHFTGHFFQPHILAITHLATLGWGTMLIFGASHQLLPVVMEVHLYSEKLAKICYWLLLPGVILLVFSFWFFWVGWTMQVGGLLVLLATILYAINAYRTAKQNKKWNLPAECMVTAAWWLVITALLGTLLVFNLRYRFFPAGDIFYLKVHAHLGIAGWFLLLIMGVGGKLIPMFLLSHKEPGIFVKVSYYGINIALLGFLIMAFVFNTLAYWPVFALIGAVSVLSYIVFVRKAYKEAARKKTELPMTITLVAIGLMILPITLLLVLALLPKGNPEVVPLSLAYGISVFGGFITAIILGQTYKTLPFIIFMHRYKKLIGKMKTPLPKDLYKHHWVKYQFISYIVGIILTIVGVILQEELLIILGSIGLVLTAVFYNMNVFFTLTHKPKEENKDDGRRTKQKRGSVRIVEG
ncbi:MAG TPA: hypothetical protein VK084_02200 [Chitinophagaceae bacterium]|nr:hypothetical protein [Chitinophagaceae bacterium]